MDLLSKFQTPLIIVGVLILLVVLVSVLWKKAGQNKAMVITGLKKRVLNGKGGLVIPFFEQVDIISLENMNIEVKTNDSLSSTGVPIDCDGVAIVKIKSNTECILQAIEQFNTGKEKDTISNIRAIVKDILEGKLREIVSKMTVEDIYRNRESFANEVEAVAKSDLEKMGLEIKTFTIREIKDENGYLTSLGAKQIAEVKKNAEIAKASAEREQREKTAESFRQAREAEIKANTQIAEAEKEQQLKIQEYKKQQEIAKADADFAYQVQQNKIQKEVIDTQKAAELLQEQKQTEIAEQQAKKNEKELDANVRKKADADRYAKEQAAEAEKYSRIKAAEAEAESIKRKGDAEAEVIRSIGQAEAEKKKALAEADEKRAKVFEQYGQAIIIEEISKKLPELAKNIAEPLSKIDNMTVIDNGGTGGGAKKITDNVTNIMATLPTVVESLTGIDLIDFIQNIGKGNEVKPTEVEETAIDVEDYQE